MRELSENAWVSREMPETWQVGMSGGLGGAAARGGSSLPYTMTVHP